MSARVPDRAGSEPVWTFLYLRYSLGTYGWSLITTTNVTLLTRRTGWFDDMHFLAEDRECSARVSTFPHLVYTLQWKIADHESHTSDRATGRTQCCKSTRIVDINTSIYSYTPILSVLYYSIAKILPESINTPRCIDTYLYCTY